MLRFIIVSFVNGILFGIMDAIINANPYAVKIFEVYKPIARTSVNAPAGIIIDIIYGFVMGFIFLVLYPSLPGGTGLMKGITFGLIAWFFRVVMYAASHWMMFNVSIATLIYILITGMVEMIVIGMVYGLFLKPVI